MMHLFNISMNRVVRTKEPGIFRTKSMRDRHGQHVPKKIVIRKLRSLY